MADMSNDCCPYWPILCGLDAWPDERYSSCDWKGALD